MIQPYVHRCTIQQGHAAGNKYRHQVEPIEIEYQAECDNCGQPYATPQQIIAHIYGELTEL